MQTSEAISSQDQTNTSLGSKASIPEKLIASILLLGLVILLLGTTGVFAYKYNQLKQQLGKAQPVAPSKTTLVNPSPAPSPVEDLIKDMETYSNSEFGFRFDYPSDFLITDRGGSSDESGEWRHFLLEMRKDSSLIILSIFPLDAVDLESWIEKHSKAENWGVDIVSPINIKQYNHASGVSAVEFYTKEFVGRSIVFNHNNKVYDLSVVYPFLYDIPNNTFNQILSTFRFIK